jgi:hypothetical protein
VGHAGALGGLYVLGFYFNSPPSIHWNYGRTIQTLYPFSI